MSLKNHIAGEKPPNLMTGVRREKSDKGWIDKKPLYLDGKLRSKIGALLRKRYFEMKIVNKKAPDLEKVLGRKLTPYDWGLKG